MKIYKTALKSKQPKNPLLIYLFSRRSVGKIFQLSIEFRFLKLLNGSKIRSKINLTRFLLDILHTTYNILHIHFIFIIILLYLYHLSINVHTTLILSRGPFFTQALHIIIESCNKYLPFYRIAIYLQLINSLKSVYWHRYSNLKMFRC